MLFLVLLILNEFAFFELLLLTIFLILVLEVVVCLVLKFFFDVFYSILLSLGKLITKPLNSFIFAHLKQLHFARIHLLLVLQIADRGVQACVLFLTYLRHLRLNLRKFRHGQPILFKIPRFHFAHRH